MTTLADLERRIAALESAGDTNEVAQPNYLTVDPATGVVGANFTGLINALGIILPTSITGFQPPTVANNQIVWQDSGNGSLVANIQGFADDAHTDSGINVGSQAPTTTWQNYATLSANSHGGGFNRASLQVSQQNEGATGPVGNIGGWTEIDTFVGGFAAMLLDAAGRSSWMQTADPLIPGNKRAGAPFLAWGAANAAFGPGVGQPLANMGVNIQVDPDGQHTGSGLYSAPNTGYYLVCCAIYYSMANAGAMALTACNFTTTFQWGRPKVQPVTFGDGDAVAAILQANAGDLLGMNLGVTQPVTLLEVDSIIGASACHVSVVQVQ